MTEENNVEALTRAVGYLRSQGGFSLDVKADGKKYVCTAHSKEVGGYSFAVGFAASGDNLDVVQADAIRALANLVKATDNKKPVLPQKGSSNGSYSKKPYSKAAGGGSSSAISLQGLSDDAFQKAKAIVKEAGYRWDGDSKLWAGGDPDQLPEWLSKREKGNGNGQRVAESRGSRVPNKTVRRAAEEEGPEESASDTSSDVADQEEDDIPF